MEYLGSGVGLHNLEIDKFLNGCKTSFYRGVYSCDNIPDQLTLEKQFTIICNLSKESESGTHFVVIVYNNGAVLYLDSLAMNITIHDDISNFLKKITVNEILFIKYRIQPLNSDTCGLYCILFVLLFDRKPKKMLMHFKRNTYNNDYICIINIETLCAE